MKPISALPPILLSILFLESRAIADRELQDSTCSPACVHGECEFHSGLNTNHCVCGNEEDPITEIISHGFRGPQCEVYFTRCDDHYGNNWECYNYGVCGYDESCLCTDEYSGKFCQDEKKSATKSKNGACAEECVNGECQYHGDGKGNHCVCPSVVDTFTNLVVQGFEGDKCETQFSTCDDHYGQVWRCYNNAVCGYDNSCICEDGFSGRYCKQSAVLQKSITSISRSEESSFSVIMQMISGIAICLVFALIGFMWHRSLKKDHLKAPEENVNQISSEMYTVSPKPQGESVHDAQEKVPEVI